MNSRYRVTRTVHFCYGHRLLGHPGRCRHLHGHSARAEITLAADGLDALGMVADFGEIQRAADAFIDAELDHNLLLQAGDPVLPTLQEAGERVFVMEAPPTAENIARLICERLRGAGLPVVEVAVWEGEASCARYRPA
ncbi:6-pyruvoyl trahydropterin synthase family protein [Inmirania thermothiophila]|uniref:6-carboxy-5,6,7,8-tetrahydropterin synthase n=1 Tax=Inmirania thermothiophila TaxID=1750597 RepID=A0A3N1YCL2_9GAMM|nr:6-carboxytetrahydropterin synthase [Inmirania thermothiophila]ROR35137.1 6-pyruvoyltetrahydropterin/6-carboxytetrahydropterin synthase [Inmirania thermothiophila]